MSKMKHFNLNRMETKELFEGAKARFVHSEKMTLACWQFNKGAVLPEHSHPHEQITTIISGQFEMTLDDEKVLLEEGMVVVIPPKVKHSGKAVTKCHIVDVFYPVREDFLLAQQ